MIGDIAVLEACHSNGHNINVVGYAHNRWKNNMSKYKFGVQFSSRDGKWEVVSDEENVLPATPLHFAVGQTNREAIEWLLCHGADPSIPVRSGGEGRAAAVASKMKDFPADLLARLEKGREVDARPPAASPVPVLKPMLKRQHLDLSPLCDAVFRGETHGLPDGDINGWGVVKGKWAKHGICIDTEGWVEADDLNTGARAGTPLHWAMVGWNLQVIPRLAEMGANLNEPMETLWGQRRHPLVVLENYISNRQSTMLDHMCVAHEFKKDIAKALKMRDALVAAGCVRPKGLEFATPSLELSPAEQKMHEEAADREAAFWEAAHRRGPGRDSLSAETRSGGSHGEMAPKAGASFSNTWVWDGKRLEPKSGASFSNSWEFDGHTIEPAAGANFSNSYTWDGRTLAPRSGASFSNSYTWDGHTWGPAAGANFSNSLQLSGDTWGKSGAGFSESWVVSGNVPVPLAAMVALGLIQ